MANIKYITENRLSAEATSSRITFLKFAIPTTIALCFFFPQVWWWFCGALLILTFNVGHIKMVGAKGEDKTLELLKSLPDDFTIFNQVQIPNPKSKTGHTEIDFIVVAPNGVFIVEVKNNNSKIIGSVDDGQWTIHKVGRGGTPYTSSLRNPLKQVNSQIWALSNYNQLQNLKIWLNGVVYFSNHSLKLEISGESKIPVFHKSGLCEHLKNFRSKTSQETNERFISLLANLKGISV